MAYLVPGVACLAAKCHEPVWVHRMALRTYLQRYGRLAEHKHGAHGAPKFSVPCRKGPICNILYHYHSTAMGSFSRQVLPDFHTMLEISND
jgi:hypothetical protein